MRRQNMSDFPTRTTGRPVQTVFRLPGKQCDRLVDLLHSGHCAMSAATLTSKGQIVIPVEIRNRYGLTSGTQVEFIDEGGVIRLVVRRRVAASDPVAGYGLIKVARSQPEGRPRRLSEFDPASMLGKRSDAT